ncbi:MAG: insulinase family protein [Verrucomicrobiota bacterium]|nr:insulinase family protein [Verrucomicrobiota bacterium]
MSPLYYITLFFSLFGLLFAEVPEAVFIEDRSALPLLSPEVANRKIAKMRLSNGLEVLLISDEKAELSAAAVAVHVGSWSDPEKYPGMAHFCEHMLFMGTETYPDENAFMRLVSEWGGSTNAMTTSDRTIYAFSSQTEGFAPLLDRFAHFFIDPLFNEAQVAREMHAVDQEFAKSIENDGWRTMMVLKETGNPSHPNHLFSCGNAETLSHIPREALVDWHHAHYSSDQMRAVLYSSLSIEELQEEAFRIFSEVPKRATPHYDFSAPITSPEQEGHLLTIRPVKSTNSLMLLWEVPSSLAQDHTLSLIAYTLQRGQKESLAMILKEEGLIEDFSLDVEEIGGKEHTLFFCSLELTEKGMAHPEQAALRLFQAFSLLRMKGVPHYLFEERNRTSQQQYQYQDREDPFAYVLDLAPTLFDESLETFPRQTLLATSYSPERLEKTLEWLTPDHAILLLLASTDTPLDHKERWMGAEYNVASISPGWMKLWGEAKPLSEMRIPEPNPFLPDAFAIVPESEDSSPLLFADHASGRAYYARCGEFLGPEVALHFHILSPELEATAHSRVLAELYLSYAEWELAPILSAAKQAGLRARFSIDRQRLQMEVKGFSPKAPLFVETLLSNLALPPISKEKYETLLHALQKEYSNGQKELSCRLAKELAVSLLCPDRFTSSEKAEERITYEEFCSFQERLFSTAYVEGFFGGNLSLKDAEGVWLDAMHFLGRTPYPKEKHPQLFAAALPAGPYVVRNSTPMQGNATLLLIDEGERADEERAAQDIAALALEEAFFQELRSKQKTGYIARSEAQEVRGRLFHTLLVQSNSHQPEELLYRFELFLEEFFSELPSNVDEPRFSQLKNGAIASLKNRYSTLDDKVALFDFLAFQRDALFSALDSRLKSLQALSYEQFLTLAHSFFDRSNHRRLAILYEGALSSPFVYRTVSSSHLAELD